MSVKSEQVDDDPDWAVDIHARRPSRRAKRRKTVSVVDTGVQRSPSTSVDGAEAAHLAAHIDGLYAHDAAFEDLLGQELHVLIEERRQRLQDAMRPDAEVRLLVTLDLISLLISPQGTPVRPFTRGEQHEFLFDHVVHDETISAVAALALRKIKLSQVRTCRTVAIPSGFDSQCTRSAIAHGCLLSRSDFLRTRLRRGLLRLLPRRRRRTRPCSPHCTRSGRRRSNTRSCRACTAPSWSGRIT
jgi:hypothetical protein